MESIIMTLLLYGKGNAVVLPHTREGFLESLEPLAADRVQFKAIDKMNYRIMVDGVPKDPESLLHFVYNPDKYYPWMGKGVTVAIRDVLDNITQARATEKAFMSSEYKPSIIVRVDALVEEFSTPEGRQKIIDDYMKPAQKG